MEKDFRKTPMTEAQRELWAEEWKELIDQEVLYIFDPGDPLREQLAAIAASAMINHLNMLSLSGE